MTEEEWRDCYYYPDYAVSSEGNVVRKKDGLILKQYPQKSGYVYVWVDRGYGKHTVPVHRLVCIAFHGEEGYQKGLMVDHINTIRNDNRASNLHWVDAKGNANNPLTLAKRKNGQIKSKNMMWPKDYIDYLRWRCRIKCPTKYLKYVDEWIQNVTEQQMNYFINIERQHLIDRGIYH